MKKILFTTTLLFLFAIAVTAQVSVKENEKAKALIELAKEFASEREFAEAAQRLQMAYDINPNLLDCKSFYLLGLSYYMMEDAPLAIKFLELAVDCEKDKATLSKAYSYLGYSYDDMGDYKQAVENCEKAIYNSSDNEQISIIYEDLANMHFDEEKGEKAIQSMKKSIAHYLKHLSITEDDVMMGSVKNEELGKRYFNLTWFASSLKLESDMIDSVVKSALSGNEDAIGYCKEYQIAYKDAIVLPDSSSEEDKSAKVLIEKAAQQIENEQYASAISNLEKAHRLSPAMFDGNTFYLLGLAYNTIKNYSSGIKYLERALNYSLDKNELYRVYSALGYAYNMLEDYSNAEINAERALYLADNNEEVLECSLRLASIYFAKDDYSSTVDSYQNAIKYYMRIHSITPKEVMKGNVKDKFLADNYMRLTMLLNKLMRGEESDDHLQKAALCGSEYAIDILEKNGIDYEW